MTPDQILDRAADALDRYGHVKNEMGSVHVGFCAMAAGHFVSSPYSTDWLLAREALTQAIGIPFAYLVAWNNAPERTKDEVTSTMRAVAATLRAQGGKETPTRNDDEQVETQALL